MPNDTKATFNGDENALNLPVGAVLIKTFYYDNVQNVTPAGSTRIVETRLMIKKQQVIFLPIMFGIPNKQKLF